MAARMQSLNVRLSYLIDDPVATYNLGGQDYSSALRDEYINQASRFLYNVFYDTYRLLVRKSRNQTNVGIHQAIDLLRDFVINDVFTSSTQGLFTEDDATDSCLVIPSGNRYRQVFHVNGIVSSGTDKRAYQIIEYQDVTLTFNTSPKYTPSMYNPIAYYTIYSSGNAIRIRPAVNDGIAYNVSYLQYPNTNLTSAGAEEIQWSSNYDEDILQLALAFVLKDDGNFQAFDEIVSRVMAHYQVATEIVRQNIAIEEQTKAKA